ncbi:LLM class flavin-dependent oxidoreductase [Actinoplanes subtropicus]|uniref:LLM class flavin-dependent oxidoreductase n=1 Tax=Actinoplanes subtropicus TaxID=543632 RepID=UPI000A575465|nr:LLM class flavin-dependent oxidoreductase [Actinoplanes subtropicus]
MSDYGHDLLFGTFVTPTNQPATHAVDLAVAADRAGLDLVTFQDHPYQSRFLDTWTLLSYAAARTSRIRLSGNVLNLPLRQPAVLARAAASLDLLSGGRFELGIGAGGFWDAIEAMGGRRLTPGQSVEALDEAITVIRELWAADRAGPVRVDGRHYRVHGAKRGPAPAHDVGIWVGAYKPRMLRLIGRAADGWLPSLGYLPGGPADLTELNKHLDDAAVAAGRTPGQIRRLLNVGGRFATTGRAFLDGPPEQWAEDLAGLTLEYGVSGFIPSPEVLPVTHGWMARQRAESLPELRETLLSRGLARGQLPGLLGSAPMELWPSMPHGKPPSSGLSTSRRRNRGATMPELRTRSIAVLGAGAALIGTALAVTAAAAGAATTVAAPAPSPPGRPSQCTGTSPITCHFAVSPGNYTVTAWIGDRASAGNTSMSVEARRRILPATSTTAGTITPYVFTVNVRQPEGQPTGQGGTGTPGLDVMFAGSAPQLSGLTVQPASKPLVVYLAGDSTVCDQPAAPYTGWGQILPTHVAAGAVIANYADSGESSGSFLNTRALFPTMIALVRNNDLVFIQFGHNDKTTTAAAYRSNLTSMVNQVRAKGGIPVLVTPPVRHLFSGGRLTPTALHVNGVGVDLPAEMRGVGSSLKVPVIDLTAKSQALVESLGPTASAQLYLRAAVDGVKDDTHFSEYGAGRIAGLVVQGIRERTLPLTDYLR